MTNLEYVTVRVQMIAAAKARAYHMNLQHSLSQVSPVPIWSFKSSQMVSKIAMVIEACPLGFPYYPLQDSAMTSLSTQYGRGS